MNAISGLLNLDGQHADASTISCLSQGMALCGYNESGAWSEGPVGLVQHVRHDSAEPLYYVHPFQHVGGRFVITANLRLDNRDDLFDAFGIPSVERPSTPDVVLLAKAYEKWGGSCPVHLVGDWAFAIWDAARRTMFLARDHMGHAGLYYYRDSRTFIFASSLKSLLNLPKVPHRLNDIALAQLGSTGKRDTSTFYQQIFQLGPGQAMEVSSEKTSTRYYWHPKDIPSICFPNDQDYVDAFLEIYREAVRCRLHGRRPVGVMLSSGLDSGSVATLATEELTRRGERLHAISWRPEYDISSTVSPDRMGDESSIVEQLCASVGITDLTFTGGDGIGPMAGTAAILGILEQPMYQDAVSYWILATLSKAQRQQIGVMLHGVWGNYTISWEGDRKRTMGQLFNSFKWGALLQELSDWRHRNGSIPRAIANRFRNNVSIKNHGSQYWRGMIKTEVARPILENSQMVDPDLEARRRQAPHPLCSIFNMFQSGSLAALSEIGASFGMEMRSPVTDKRIVEFCLGIPLDQYSCCGNDRLLIRRAMSGLMPEHILWNRRRGMLAGDIGFWFRKERTEMAAALHKMDHSPLAQHWLDLPRMKGIFHDLEQKFNPAGQSDLQVLMRGIMVGLFLQRFEGG